MDKNRIQLLSTFINLYQVLSIFMYLYSFDKFAGPDKVFTITKWNAFCKKVKIGDLVKSGEEIFVCLGDEISFPEQYVYFHVPKMDMQILHKWLLSPKAVQMIHRMVYTYYSTYKSVMKYFVSDDWEKLLGLKPKRVKRNEWCVTSYKIANLSLSLDTRNSAQTLVVYPDLWTIMNSVDEKELTKKEVAFLSSTNSQWQKDKHRWAVKTWNVSMIYASPSEIFHDFYDLKKIIFIDPHKRYYANQQDPRFKVGAVLQRMSELYDVQLEIIGN